MKSYQLQIFGILLIMMSIVWITLAGIDSEETCKKLLGKNDKISDSFPYIVAHGIHSMTLANLRYYFDSSAPSDNSIPVVNFNLSKSEPPTLPSTPDIILHNNFTHPAMDALDQVLSHMTDNDWGIRHAPPLERVVHAMHMLEVWSMAAPFYKKLKSIRKLKRKEKLADICGCLSVVFNKPITQLMQKMARIIRANDDEQRYGYRYRLKIGGKKKEKRMFNPENQAKTNLTNEAEWEIWKVNNDLSQYVDFHSYQLALYIYCALN